jgi:hypothetical protein
MHPFSGCVLDLKSNYEYVLSWHLNIAWCDAAAPESRIRGVRIMLTRILALAAFGIAASGFVAVAPRPSFATTKSDAYVAGDNSIMYRRRHGADDGDADDLPGGYHAGEDDRDADDFRRGDETHREPTVVLDPKSKGGKTVSEDKSKPKPDPIGR